MTNESLKDAANKYGLWIGLCGILLTAGSQMGSCGSSIFGAGGTLAKKADTAKVQVIELQVAKLQECMDGLRARQARLYSKVDKMDEKIDRILERVKK